MKGLLPPHTTIPAVGRLDDAVATRLAQIDLGPAIDTTLRRLSTAANHGRLWFGVAAGLALTGTKGRNAAVRGLASLAVASAAANLVAKPLFGGERPETAALQAVRRLRKQPSSGAFPSGHSASAAAFATGAAISWPATAAVLGPLAGAVALSRLHTGAHWFSDVVAGAAMGTAIGLAGGAFLPDEYAPEPDGQVGPGTSAPRVGTGATMAVLVNPGTGSGRLSLEEPAIEIARAFPDARVLVPGKDGMSEDLGVVLESVATEPGLEVLGICGGDGSVSAAAGLARQHGLTSAVFPGGTLNHFAKALGVGTIAEAIDAIAAGNAAAVDVADLTVTAPDGEQTASTVLNTFSLGAYPQLVDVRERFEHRLGKWLADVLAAGAMVRDGRPVTLGGLDDGSGDTDDERPSWLCFAGVNRYWPTTLAPATRTNLSTGVLDVREVPAGVPAGTARVVLDAVLGNRGRRLLAAVPRLRALAPMQRFETARLTLTCRGLEAVGQDVPGGVSVAHDGEIEQVAASPDQTVGIDLAIAPGALRVYVPASGKAH